MNFSNFSSAVNVTVVRVTTTTDAYGDSVTTESRTEIPGCLFAPRSSTDRTDPRTPAVLSGATVYTGSGGSIIDSDDKLIVNGRTYAVEGDPGAWGSEGVEVAVSRWVQP